MTGEPLALDFVNTRLSDVNGETELLDSEDAVRAWIEAEDGRLTVPAGPIEAALIRALRDQVMDAVTCARAGRAPSGELLDALTEAQRAAPRYRELSWDVDGAVVTVTVRHDGGGDATLVLLAELADATVDLLADTSVGRIRRCEGPYCRILFLPASPRRRWCSPAICGNRVRVARYYENHKAPDAPRTG